MLLGSTMFCSCRYQKKRTKQNESGTTGINPKGASTTGAEILLDAYAATAVSRAAAISEIGICTPISLLPAAVERGKRHTATNSTHAAMTRFMSGTDYCACNSTGILSLLFRPYLVSKPVTRRSEWRKEISAKS